MLKSLFLTVHANSGGDGGRRYRQMGSRNTPGPLKPNGRASDLQDRTGRTRAPEGTRTRTGGSRATQNTRNFADMPGTTASTRKNASTRTRIRGANGSRITPQ